MLNYKETKKKKKLFSIQNSYLNYL